MKPAVPGELSSPPTHTHTRTLPAPAATLWVCTTSRPTRCSWSSLRAARWCAWRRSRTTRAPWSSRRSARQQTRRCCGTTSRRRRSCARCRRRETWRSGGRTSTGACVGRIAARLQGPAPPPPPPHTHTRARTAICLRRLRASAMHIHTTPHHTTPHHTTTHAPRPRALSPTARLRLVGAFGSTRRRRQLQQRADAAVVVTQNASVGEIDMLMQEVRARAQAAGDTRGEVRARWGRRAAEGAGACSIAACVQLRAVKECHHVEPSPPRTVCHPPMCPAPRSWRRWQPAAWCRCTTPWPQPRRCARGSHAQCKHVASAQPQPQPQQRTPAVASVPCTPPTTTTTPPTHPHTHTRVCVCVCTHLTLTPLTLPGVVGTLCLDLTASAGGLLGAAHVWHATAVLAQHRPAAACR
jgi:hypothetical protein